MGSGLPGIGWCGGRRATIPKGPEGRGEALPPLILFEGMASLAAFVPGGSLERGGGRLGRASLYPGVAALDLVQVAAWQAGFVLHPADGDAGAWLGACRR